MRRGWCTAPPGAGCAPPAPGGTGSSGYCARRATCGAARWTSTAGGASAKIHRWPATSSCAGSWRQPGRGPSASSTAPGRGRCCAATPTPGSPPRPAARPGTRPLGAVPAAQAGPGPGPLVRGHVHPGRAGIAAADGERLPPDSGAAGPRRALPRRPGPVGHPRVRRRAPVPRRDRRGPRRHLPRRRRTRPQAGGGRGPGHHPPLRSRRTRRAAAAGIRARHPGRVPPAPARPQGPLPRRRPPRPQARAARVTAVAAAPPQRARGRRPAPAAGPPGPARGRQDRGVLGRRAPGGDAGGRRPPRRAEPERRPAAQPADPRLAGRAPHPRPDRQGRGRRDHRPASRRAGHLLHLPRLHPPGPQARRAELQLPALRAPRAPRPNRGRQHRRPQRRRPHPRNRTRRGDHAPPSRHAPSRCAPGTT
jgi:hypothetical protein